jgi:hypothetical protein
MTVGATNIALSDFLQDDWQWILVIARRDVEFLVATHMVKLQDNPIRLATIYAWVCAEVVCHHTSLGMRPCPPIA